MNVGGVRTSGVTPESSSSRTRAASPWRTAPTSSRAPRAGTSGSGGGQASRRSVAAAVWRLAVASMSGVKPCSSRIPRIGARQRAAQTISGSPRHAARCSAVDRAGNDGRPSEGRTRLPPASGSAPASSRCGGSPCPHRDGIHRRREPPPVPAIQVGPTPCQDADDLDVSFSQGHVQRRRIGGDRVGSAPASTGARTASVWPCPAAACNGTSPCGFAAASPAPASASAGWHQRNLSGRPG